MKFNIAMSTALLVVACGGSNEAAKDSTTVTGANGTYGEAEARVNATQSGTTTAGMNGENTNMNTPTPGAGASNARTSGANTGNTGNAGNTGGSAGANGSNGSNDTATKSGMNNGAPGVNTPSSSDKAPDNTKVNERDRGNTPTPVTQGNSQAEINISAAIRRAVVGNKALGFNAKNVKIITVGTKVTLRGPVATAEERSIIENHARQTPGVTDVDNQIEIKK